MAEIEIRKQLRDYSSKVIVYPGNEDKSSNKQTADEADPSVKHVRSIDSSDSYDNLNKNPNLDNEF